MSDQQAVRSQLENRLEQLEQRLGKIERNRRRVTNALDPDWAEQAVVRQNDQILDSLHAEETIQIMAIQAALKRMDEGTYGICLTCDNPIAKKRLEALPYTTRCIECAEKAERTGR
jgi:DnaK suppressor protein